MTPKEDPEDKKDRLRERRMASMERTQAAQETASDLTTDLRSVYGLRGISMFGAAMPKAKKPAAKSTYNHALDR